MLLAAGRPDHIAAAVEDQCNKDGNKGESKPLRFLMMDDKNSTTHASQSHWSLLSTMAAAAAKVWKPVEPPPEKSAALQLGSARELLARTSWGQLQMPTLEVRANLATFCKSISEE